MTVSYQHLPSADPLRSAGAVPLQGILRGDEHGQGGKLAPLDSAQSERQNALSGTVEAESRHLLLLGGFRVCSRCMLWGILMA
jgi:hypothetical protein